MKFRISCLFALFTTIAAASGDPGVRLKDLVTIEGVRPNQLVGYGLVVGLNGTGDRQQTLFSAQSLTNLLQRMGVSVSPTLITVKNTAAVIVTATLPPFAQPGEMLDATVAAIGDASNLQGGLLVMTSLRGINGQVYSTAQGPVITGGFLAGRGSANTQTVNHPTVGRIPNGASVERPAPSIPLGSVIKLQLKEADFTTSARISSAVNKHFGPTGAVANAENSSLVTVTLAPRFVGRATEFVAELENVQVEPDRIARIIINERTGTVVLGNEVHIRPVAIMHGNLTVEIQTQLIPVPPGPYSSQPGQVVPQTAINANAEKSRNVLLNDGATVEELVKALASIGSTTRDVIAILESLRAAGALDAEVEVI
ncbi:MAG: flagellar basal body P-ring protein FlgI [Acidobacteriaceae bacterium]|nr:flagellar basal body P-ring protein FlgI [Acidobacteriaceae bacterium]MBV8571481.1 flagellar basal body P-ring protein FlgI [Acidobacteriaceae bacterium]